MSENKLTGYDLTRDFFDWSYENPDLIRPVHVAIYMFAIEHCNRLGWKSKFGFPTQMTMDAVGIKNWRTYINAFNDLCEWGFFTLHQKSKNQYSANVIAIVKNTKAHTKALSKAQQSHLQKHSNSIVGIDKHINNITYKPITAEIENLCLEKTEIILQSFEKWKDYLAKQHDVILQENEFTQQILIDAIKRIGKDKIVEAIEFSIISNYKKIYEQKEYQSNKPKPDNKKVNDPWAEKKRQLGIEG